MAYEPSGDTRLEGEAILKRLAEHLGIEVVDLEVALKNTAAFNKSFRGPAVDKTSN